MRRKILLAALAAGLLALLFDGCSPYSDYRQAERALAPDTLRGPCPPDTAPRPAEEGL